MWIIRHCMLQLRAGQITSFLFQPHPADKMSGLQGDLALLATPGTRGLPIGHITAHNADHALNLEFARALRTACTAKDYVAPEPTVIAEVAEVNKEQQQQEQS